MNKNKWITKNKTYRSVYIIATILHVSFTVISLLLHIIMSKIVI